MMVEDDKFMLDLVVKEFNLHGCIVLKASTGEEAMKLLEEERPALIMLDILLPGMNGFEVLQKIKEHPTLKDIPVVILSNMQSKEDVEKSKQLGALKYFVKAMITPRQILDEVTTILNSHKA